MLQRTLIVGHHLELAANGPPVNQWDKTRSIDTAIYSHTGQQAPTALSLLAPPINTRTHSCTTTLCPLKNILQSCRNKALSHSSPLVSCATYSIMNKFIWMQFLVRRKNTLETSSDPHPDPTFHHKYRWYNGGMNNKPFPVMGAL